MKALTLAERTPLRLRVIDKDSIVVGTILCRVGLLTYAGPVSRFTEHTVWTVAKSGVEQRFRQCDGRMPGVYRSRARASEVEWFAPMAATSVCSEGALEAV